MRLRPARAVRGVFALLGAAGLGVGWACSGPTETADRPGGASLNVRMAISIAQQTGGPSFTVRLQGLYKRTDGVTATLADRTVPLGTGAQQIPLSVDLGPCLGDTGRSQATDCGITVLAILLRDGVAVDQFVIGPLTVKPGVATTVPSQVALYEITSVSVTPATTTLSIGGTQQFTAAAASPQGPVPRTPTWSSSAPGVATVSASGLVTAVAAGTATITADFGAKTATATITVNAVPPALTGVTLTPTTATIAQGGTAQLAAQATGVGTGVTVTFAYQSSNTSVATVGATSGLVTAVAPGTATMTVTASGSGAGFSSASRTATATITVTAPAQQPGTISGRVYNATTNAPLAGAVFTLVSGGTVITTATSGADGQFITSTVPGGTYSATVNAVGFVTVSLFSVLVDGPRQVEAVPQVPLSDVTGGIAGEVRDATTNASTGQVATMELRAGMNAVTGTPLASLTTGTDGSYSFTALGAGVYTVLAKVPGYANGARTGITVGGSTVANQNLFVSPTGTVATVRMVLSWGTTPSDLDSHLTGPPVAPDTTRFWVYYGSRGNCAAAPFACLDVDVTSGLGPETMTITQVRPGVYRYSVNNYSDAGNNSAPASTTLASSNARVDLYFGNSLYTSFFVPNGAGSLWTVFELNGTTVTTINTITAGPPPAYITGGSTTSSRDAEAARIRNTRTKRSP